MRPGTESRRVLSIYIIDDRDVSWDMIDERRESVPNGTKHDVGRSVESDALNPADSKDLLWLGISLVFFSIHIHRVCLLLFYLFIAIFGDSLDSLSLLALALPSLPTLAFLLATSFLVISCFLIFLPPVFPNDAFDDNIGLYRVLYRDLFELFPGKPVPNS